MSSSLQEAPEMGCEASTTISIGKVVRQGDLAL